MSLTRNEVVQTANLVILKTNTFCDKVNNIINELNSLEVDLNAVSLNITNKILANDIVSGSSNYIKKIFKRMDDVVTFANTTINDAVKACNSYISDLEDDYNLAHRDEKALVLPRANVSFNSSLTNGVSLEDTSKSTNPSANRNSTLPKRVGSNTQVNNSSQVTLATQRNDHSSLNESNQLLVNEETDVTVESKITDEAVSKPDVKTDVETSEDSISNAEIDTTTTSNKTITNIVSAEEINKYLDEILQKNLFDNIDSDYINNWDRTINQFLRINGFDNNINTISVRNKKVVFHPKNQGIIEFENIESSYDLIKTIKDYFNI